MFRPSSSPQGAPKSSQEGFLLESVGIPVNSQCLLKKVKVIEDGKESVIENGPSYTVLMPEGLKRGLRVSFPSVIQKGSVYSLTKIDSIKKVNHVWELRTANSVYHLSVDDHESFIQEKRQTIKAPEAPPAGTFYAGKGELIKKEYFAGGELHLAVYVYGLHRGEDAVGLGEDVTVVCDGVGTFQGASEFSRFLATEVSEKINHTTSNEEVDRIVKGVVDKFRAHKRMEMIRGRNSVDIDLSSDGREKGWYSTISILLDRGNGKYDFFYKGDSPLYVYDTKEDKIRVSFGDETAGKKEVDAVGVSFPEKEGTQSFSLKHKQISLNEGEVILVTSDFFSDNMAFEQHHETEVARLAGKKKKGELLTNEESSLLSRLEMELKLYKNYVSCKPGEERERWLKDVLEKRNPKLASVFRYCSQKSMLTEFVGELMKKESRGSGEFKALCEKYSYLARDDATFVVVTSGKRKL